jgi:hypothetical protein
MCVVTQRKTTFTQFWVIYPGLGSTALRHGSAAARLLGLRVRIPVGAWSYVSFECCVLSPRWADPSSKGVLPSAVCLCVISKLQQRGGLGPSSAAAIQDKKAYNY